MEHRRHSAALAVGQAPALTRTSTKMIDINTLNRND